jgi:predicted TPR repeat methyltransferase
VRTSVPGFEASIPLGRPDRVVDRRRYLVERSRGARVVHLGCADERLTSARAGTGNLLHEELARVASSLIGVDLSEDALSELERLVPGRYLVGDVERLSELDLPSECDVVLAPELIEHLGRPADFLVGMRSYLARSGARGVITTPNAYSWTHFVRFAGGRREWVHPDHRALYSPATLRKTLEAAGLRVVDVGVHRWDRRARGRDMALEVLDRALLRWNPWLGVGLVVEVAPA